MSSNPWLGLTAPASRESITARRVDAGSKWDLFWAVDCERHVLLIMKHGLKSSPKSRLPKLREIDVRLEVLLDGQPALVWRLLAHVARDIFFRLCSDIAEATARCASEAEAVEIAVARTWRWHHLLKGGTSGLLSSNLQMGLIGELMVLESYLLPLVGPDLAVSSWLGPLDAAQDFRVGNVAIESKAIASENAGSVRISSEYQLSNADVDWLYLHVCHVDAASSDDSDALTLTEYVARVRLKLTSANPSAKDRFDALLVAAGYSDDDDYSAFTWNASERSVFCVDDAFPRLTLANVPSGVEAIGYTIDLSLCGAFLISPETLQEKLAPSIQ